MVSLLYADLGTAISTYLLGAMWGGKTAYLSGIVLFDIVLLLFLYLVAPLSMGGKEREHEVCRNL